MAHAYNAIASGLCQTTGSVCVILPQLLTGSHGVLQAIPPRLCSVEYQDGLSDRALTQSDLGVPLKYMLNFTTGQDEREGARGIVCIWFAGIGDHQ